ncbi:hypothetical protein QEH52_02100 [Coraliomargarita sp. SDUM461003]|uniref:EF-hand domain-containing protein n=1 Tax=Thalassobacterium maritimum TaxID=3041265 RepID=A0ABU1ARN6_9BACT|nr:hypothetical protein [Coraliomargarita sp. SDUM461003]MDQ8206282.1 hypothetical protein [Coraliomargarita sp. SDUM461003]
MNTKSLILLVLSSSLIGITAQAKPEGEPRDNPGKRPSPQELFQRLDADENGTLSLEEVKGPLAEQFDKIDADGDGELTKKELIAANKDRRQAGKDKGPQRRGQNIKAADTNEDGSISKAEATEAGLERLLEHFDEIDADGDGEITREEMKAMAKGKRQGPPEDE